MTFPEVESQPNSAVNQTRMKRQLADQAIAQATAAQWSEAADTNRKLLELGPDAEAENRLAKALWELGELGAARVARMVPHRRDRPHGPDARSGGRSGGAISRPGAARSCPPRPSGSSPRRRG